MDIKNLKKFKSKNIKIIKIISNYIITGTHIVAIA